VFVHRECTSRHKCGVSLQYFILFYVNKISQKENTKIYFEVNKCKEGDYKFATQEFGSVRD